MMILLLRRRTSIVYSLWKARGGIIKATRCTFLLDLLMTFQIPMLQSALLCSPPSHSTRLPSRS